MSDLNYFHTLSILGAVFETENSESDINNEILSKHIIFSLKYFRFYGSKLIVFQL